MMKRALSILLCLIMVLGLAAPSVQAATEVSTTTDLMDGITIDGDFSGNIVIDGNTVTSSGETKLPYPTDLLEQGDPSYTFGAAVPETSAPAYECKCADLSTAVEHVGICDIKRPYIEQCEASEEELFALWGSYTLVEQDFILSYLSENYPLKHKELQKLLNAPTGTDSETLTDGTTVSVQGIPQDGSLTVGQTTDEIKDIVDAYVAEKEEEATPLFSYDVSVQDAEGADWQPETNVKMELELPGQKLHKNTQVYVVHVDDEGNATTIEATVTEDGKIAFETPGFSAFYGFTVDFHYENITFSIPGESSIKLSELFDNLKMPLNAEDVVALEYTNDTQLKIEKLEGDWLLTSLQAFTTEEKLTITMADGTVFNVKVTDVSGERANCYFSTREDQQTPEYEIDMADHTGDNGVMTVQLTNRTAYYGWQDDREKNYYRYVPYKAAGVNDSYITYFAAQPLVFDGRDVNGAFEVCIEKGPDVASTVTSFTLDLWNWYITNGAVVNVYFTGFNSGDTIVFRQFYYSNAGWNQEPMFTINDGSLYFNVTDSSLLPNRGFHTSDSGIKVVFDHQRYGTTHSDAIVFIDKGRPVATGYENFVANNVTFRDSAWRGIYCKADGLGTLRLDNCTFTSSLGTASDAGGAIYLEGYTNGATTPQNNVDGVAQVNIDHLILNNCTFNKCTQTDTITPLYGGAIFCASNLDDTQIINCTFNDLEAQTFGGAIAFGFEDDLDFGMGSLTVSGCTFKNCKALANQGGAVSIRVQFTSINFTESSSKKCTFTNCTAKSYGGAVFMGVTKSGVKRLVVGNVTFDGCTFSNCSSNSMGGDIASDCDKLGNVTISNSTFTGSSGTYGGSILFGSTVGGDPITVGNFSVNSCKFTNCRGSNVGGSLCLIDGTYNSISFDSTSFDNCTSNRYSGAIYMRTNSVNLPFEVTNDISIIGCSFKDCRAGYLKNEPTERTNGVPNTWDHDDDPDTAPIDKLNGVGGGGALTIGGKINGKVEIKGKSAANPTRFVNCTSWNNGGAIAFPTAVTDDNAPEFGAVELQYLDMDKCFARDAGFAMYIATVVMHDFKMTDCTVQNCGFFDLSDPNFPADKVFPTDGSGLPTEWFAKDGLTDEYITKWQGYTYDALCRSMDNGGNIRTIGNAHVIANIENCEFKNNKSFSGGAGVYWNSLEIVDGLLPSLTLTNCIFDGNYARSNGGGIYCEGTITINSCEFKNNVAGMYGGAIAQQVYNNVDRPLSEDESNKIILGYATPVEGAEKVPTKFHHNKAQNGGAIAITVAKTESVNLEHRSHYPIEFTLGGAHVYNNTATYNGGGVYYATYTYNVTADQDEVDYFQKKINLNDGLIWGNVSGASATKVEDGYTPQVGDQLIIAAVDSNMALGSDQYGNIGAESTITKYNTSDVIFDNTALILTWRPGNQSDTYAFENPDGTYLAANATSGSGTATNDYQFGKVSYETSTNAWVVTIASNGVATIKVKETMNDSKKRSVMRFNHNTGNAEAPDGWFNIYTAANAASADCTDILIYRVTSEMHSHGTASLVTDINSLNYGDRFIFVAFNPNLTEPVTMKPSDWKTRRVSYLTYPTYNDVTYSADTHVITLEDGTASGTYKFRIGTDTYLGGRASDAQFATITGDLATSDWIVEIDPNGKAKLVLHANASYTTGTRNTLKYHLSNDTEPNGWFNIYAADLANPENRCADIAIYRVTSEDNRKAALVTRDGALRAGDKIILVAREYNWAVSVNGTASYKQPTAITKYDDTMTFSATKPTEYLDYSNLTYGEETQIITLETGTVSNTFALQVGAGQYLGPKPGDSNTANLSELVTVTEKANYSSWNITIDSLTGEASVVAQGSGTRNVMRYNLSGWFNTYVVNNGQQAICIYRVTSEELRSATLVTKNTDLKAGEKYIIVAKDYDFALSTTQNNTVRMLSDVTKTKSTGSNTQVLTVVGGSTSGTYALQTMDGKYLSGGLDKLTLSTSINADSSWTLTVADGKLIAVSNGANKYYLRYSATNHVFTCFGNADTSTNSELALYKCGTETGGGHGGGVYMNSNQYNTSEGGYSKLSIVGGSIYGNVSYVGNGGGVYLTGTNALCEIDGETTTVGAQYLGKTEDGKVNLSTNQGNTAFGVSTGENQFIGGNGGGIAIFGSARIEMAGGYVVNNKATTAGGGIAVHNKSSMYFTDGTVEGNTSSMGGGISLNDAQAANANPTASTPDKDRYGMLLDGGNVLNNMATPNNSGFAYGGGICVSAKSTMRINGGMISGNIASSTSEGKSFAANQEGGAIAVCQESYLETYGGTITNNKAYSGGAIVVRGNSELKMLPMNVTVDGQTVTQICHIDDNWAKYWGGGIYLPGADSDDQDNLLTLDGGIVSNNVASTQNGGGIFVGAYANLSMTGGEIHDNYTKTWGGGIWVGNTEATASLSGGKVYNNTASNGGGLCVQDHSILNLGGTEIYGNTAGSGGGIFSTINGTTTITAGKIYNNTSTGNGGGIELVAGSTLTINGGEITGNRAVDGAGIRIYKTSGYSATSLTMNGGLISGNIASGNGGGVYAGYRATVNILASDTDHGEISENIAKNGGGVYVTEGANLTVKDGYIINNQAVAPTDPDLTTAYGNDAQLAGVGGGICVTAGTSSYQSTFTLTGTKTSGRMDVAIFGNTATFAADDVFASGNYTKLTVPTIDEMNLAGYGFRPEAWTEDYVTGDTSYKNGTRMLTDTLISQLGITRYRNATPAARKSMVISASTVTNLVNASNKYVCMTLGIPGATKDTVLVDYDGIVDVEVWQNDLFMEMDNYKAGHVYIGETFPQGALHKDGISCSQGTKPLANIIKDKNGKDVSDSYADTFTTAFSTVKNNNNGVLTFRLNATDIGGGYDFYYTIERSGFWYYASVSVIPATSIYYDDTSIGIEYHEESDYENLAAWETVGTEVDQNQSLDRPGTLPGGGQDADNIYGYDPNYGLPPYYGQGGAINSSANATPVYANAPAGTRTLFVDISDTNWNHATIYTWDANKKEYTGKWPGTSMHHLVDQVYYYHVPTSATMVIFNNGYGGGPNQTNDLAILTDGRNRFDANTSGNQTGGSWSVHEYYLIGKINGSNVGFDTDNQNNGKYRFVNGKLVASFTEDSYVFLKTEGGTAWYMTESYTTGTTGTFKDTAKYNATATEKMLVPGGREWVFTLKETATGLTLSYECNHKFANGYCTVCGYMDPDTSATYYSGGSSHKVTVGRHIGVDANGDNKCDECGVAIQLTHEYVSKNVTGQCKICLNQPEQHGDNVPEHTCFESSTYNEYCDLCGKWIGTHTTNARATFTFNGTGFDVIGLSGANTGIVMVTVFKGVVEDWDNPWTNEYVASYMVDTYYGYRYDEDLEKWVQSDEADTILYQVPAIKVDLSRVEMSEWNPDKNDYDLWYQDYGYGTYSVEIYIAPSFLESEHGYWETEFYLDGIRIYNPAGIGGSENEEAYDAYIADNENWPVYAELRNMFITQQELGVTSTNGVIFIDGNTTPTIEQYKSWGPNNEVYLNPGESVAFTLNASNYALSAGGDLNSDMVAGVHLGMRGLTGFGKVSIYQNQTKFKTIDMGTTDMYYDITDLMNQVVTITNEGSTPISLTNVKITHKYAPVVSGNLGDLFTMDDEAANVALNVFTPEQLADPVLKPKYPALSFEGMVSYNVFFTAEDLGDLNGADLGLAVFDHYDAEGTVETAKDVILGATQIDGLYMVATNGVHAKYLGDTQYFRAFAKKADGTYVYSKMVSYSALDYAKNALEKSSDVKLKQLVVAMLNYGAEAQKFFGYNTDDLMNKDLTAEQQALVSGIDAGALNAVGKVDASKVGMFASTGGFAKKYPAISFKGAFEINYFMAPSNAVDNDMRLYVWNEDTYNNATELTVNNADKVVTMTLENGLYTASSDQIAAKDLDETVYVAAVYESNGQLYCSGVLPYSIAAYCQKPAADVASLANAAAVYGCAAKEFFGA